MSARAPFSWSYSLEKRLSAKPSHLPKKRATYLAAAALLPMLFCGQPKPALADSDIEDVLGALALTVASIRVVAESCKLDPDPILEARIFEAVATVPGIRMTEVSGLFIRSYENEVHFAGRECAPVMLIVSRHSGHLRHQLEHASGSRQGQDR